MKEETEIVLNQVASGMTKVAAMVREDTNEALQTGNHVVVIKHFAKLRGAVELIKQARKALEEIEDDLSKVRIPDIVRDLKTRTGEKPPFKIEGVGSVSIANKTSCSIIDDPVEGKRIGYRWLKENDHGELVVETVNSSTLSAFAKDILESGHELPEDIFKVSIQHYTSIRKG